MENCPESKICLKATSFSQNAPESQLQHERGFPGDAVLRGSCLGLRKPQALAHPSQDKRALKIGSFFF